MLLVGLRYRVLAPGLMEQLCLLELVQQFLQYPNMCAFDPARFSYTGLGAFKHLPVAQYE